MKLLTTSAELGNEFSRLTKQYESFYWATAWASAGAKPFDALWANSGKIRKLVVGIHFYQTHPDFIELFVNDKNGSFHPATRRNFSPQTLSVY